MVFLVGISGAGKDTIKSRLLVTGEYHDIVSHTTRAPRENRGVLEKDGIDYHFVTMEQIKGMLVRHELVEANLYSNNVYATSTAEFEKAQAENKIPIADIDINGVASYQAIAPKARPIFLIPPSYDVWVERWRRRYGDDYASHMDDFERRKQTAIRELEHSLAVPYFYYVINDDLDKTAAAVEAIARTGKQAEEDRDKGRRMVQAILDAMRNN